MRWLAFLLYGSVLLVGTWLILQRTDAQRLAFYASRSLPANHLLRDGDITPAPWYQPELFPAGPHASDFAGRYLKGSLISGEAIRRDETSAVPMLDVDAPTWMLAMPVVQQLVDKGEIEPRQNASLCLRPAHQQAQSSRAAHKKAQESHSHLIKAQVRVNIVALVCSAAAPTPCTVLLRFEGAAAKRAVNEWSGRYTVVSLATGDQPCR